MAHITEKIPTANASRIRDRRGAEGPSKSQNDAGASALRGTGFRGLEACSQDRGSGRTSGWVPAPEIRARTGSCPTLESPRRTAARGTSRDRSTPRGGGSSLASRSPEAAMNGDERSLSAERPTPVSGSSPSGAGSRSARRANSSSGSIRSCRPRIRARPAADRRTFGQGVSRSAFETAWTPASTSRGSPPAFENHASRPAAAARRLKPLRRPPSAARRFRERPAPPRPRGTGRRARPATAPRGRRPAGRGRSSGPRSARSGVTPIHVPPATRSRPASRPSRPCQ